MKTDDMNLNTIDRVDDILKSVAIRTDSTLSLDVLGPSSRVEAMRLWSELEARLSNRRLMCSAVWTDTWLTHFGSQIPHRFAVARRGEIPCGIALLTSGIGQHAGPFPLKTWHVGTAGEPDADSVCVEYNTLLVSEADRHDFADALRRWTFAQSECDEFRMDGFTDHDLNRLLSSESPAFIQRKLSRYFDLKMTRDEGVDPITRLSYNTRATIRRSIRLLGQPQGEWIDTLPRAESAFLEMVELHQARWQAAGEPGSYASNRFHSFHLDLMHRLVPRGQMKMFRVASGERLIGGLQLLIDDNRVLVYQAGWAECAGNTSPGVLIDYLCLAESQRRGYDAFDLLAGDSVHKQRLTTHANELVWATWRKPHLKNSVLDSLRTLKRVLKRLKESYSSNASPETNSSDNDCAAN